MSFVKLREDAKENDKTGAAQPSLHPVSGGTGTRPEVYLGKGTKVVGTLTFAGPTEIDCHVEGEIQSKEILTIGESAVVNAKVVGGEIVVRGTVTGDIIATKRLTLKRPSKISGNITATTLSIEEGVLFEGKCTMNNAGTSADTHGSSKSSTDKAGVAA